MLTKSERSFTSIFVIILAAELICGSVQSLSQLHYLTKPFIVISLLIFVWTEGRSVSTSIRNLTLMGLVFSLLGDVLLMFVDLSPNYFMFGLVAFLLAHLMYILVFLKHRNTARKPFWAIGILDMYAIALFLFLKDHLGDMLIPVLIYILVILIMVSSAVLRKDRVSKFSYNLVIIGAILFMLSDSILAVDKFYHTLPFASAMIMSTYACAQFFIMMGIKKSQ